MTVFKPGALDFAQLLHVRQELEDQARPYLTRLQPQLRTVLEGRDYQEVHVRTAAESLQRPDVAAETTVVVVARLPLEGLKTPVFRVRLPLVVTYSGHLVVEAAQINKLTLRETFVQDIAVEGGQMADMLVQFFSERYMEYLLGLGMDPR